MSDEISEARIKLVEALGDNEKCYFDLLRSWFRMQRTKEEFDAEARKLLSYVNVPLHNRFMLALFKRCQGLDSSPSPVSDHSKRKDASKSTKSTTSSVSAEKEKKSKVKRRHSEKSAFEGVNVGEYCTSPGTPPSNLESAMEHQCSRTLPDQPLICGRMLVAAWEHDLTGVDTPAEEYLALAMEVFLKNIIQAVMMRKTGYKLTSSGFVYDLGGTVPNPWLLNTAKLNRGIYNRCAQESDDDEDPDKITKMDVSLEDIEANTAYSIACGSGPSSVVTPISAWDMLEMMQVERRLFRANSVYILNVERLIMLLEHPSHEEIEAASKC